MRPRVLLLGAGIWALVYAGVYVAIIRSQNDSGIALWYLVVILLGACLALAAAAQRRPWAKIAALVALSVAALLGIASIGLLLLPSLVGLALAVGSTADRHA